MQLYSYSFQTNHIPYYWWSTSRTNVAKNSPEIAIYSNTAINSVGATITATVAGNAEGNREGGKKVEQEKEL